MNRPGDLRIDTTEEFQHLPGAPIVEAVIHWQARPTVELDRTRFVGALKERLGDYPFSKELRTYALEAAVNAGSLTAKTQPEQWAGVRLESTDRRYVAQFRRDGLAVSRLHPYEDWKRFSSEALRLWDVYIELAAPADIARLGVRFINRVGPVDPASLEDWLQYSPRRLSTLGMPVADFFYRSTHQVPGHPYRVTVTDALESMNPDGSRDCSLIVDIDAFTTRGFSLNDDSLGIHLENLRWLKNKAFFGLLTGKAVDRFNMVQA